jgi:hypothetical protein
MLCTTAEGRTLMFPDVDPEHSAFKTEDELVLEVQELAAFKMPANGANPCRSPSCAQARFSITNVVANNGGGRDRRNLPTGPRSTLMVRMIYQDSAPAFCDEACMRKVMWSGSQNTNGMFSESSYGKITFPESQGQIVSITLQKRVQSLSNCPFWDMGLEADAAVRAQHGIDPDSFTHRSYYIPADTPGCYFGGVAYIGCSQTHCKSWIRSSNGPVLAHELGHNLGLQHAGLDANNDGSKDGGLSGEYGDHSGIMGNSALWRGVNAPHRLQLGWLAPTNVLTLAAATSRTVTINTLFGTPGSGYSAVKIPRPTGGNYWVSFRGSQGYDRTMSTSFVSKVQVKYELSVAQPTMHIKGLTNGQSFSDGSLSVTVKSLTANSASVQFGGGGGPSPPPPSPPPPPPGDGSCTDKHQSCSAWKQAGYCASSSQFYTYMSQTCRQACGLCGGGGDDDGGGGGGDDDTGTCSDNHASCNSWQTAGYCDKSSQYYNYVSQTCPKACSICNGGGNGGNGGGGGGGDSSCKDIQSSCSTWKASGYCATSSKYYDYMLLNCQSTCSLCEGQTTKATTSTPATTRSNGCSDTHASCDTWRNAGYCATSSQFYTYMHKTCPKTCNICGGTTVAPTTTTVQEMSCTDAHINCGRWAQRGYCTSSTYKPYMQHDCLRACGFCSTANRIPNPPTATTAVPVVHVVAADAYSVKTCAELGWQYAGGNKAVCASSKPTGECLGEGDERKMSYGLAHSTCKAVGARLCTSIELYVANVAKGSGCNLDYAWIWTSEQCPKGSVSKHYRATGSGLHDQATSSCRRDDVKAAGLRCCADIQAPQETGALKSMSLPPSVPGSEEKFNPNLKAAGYADQSSGGHTPGATAAAVACVAVLTIGLVGVAFMMRSRRADEDEEDEEARDSGPRLGLAGGESSRADAAPDHHHSHDGNRSGGADEVDADDAPSLDFVEGGFQLDQNGSSLRVSSIKRENPIFAQRSSRGAASDSVSSLVPQSGKC